MFLIPDTKQRQSRLLLPQAMFVLSVSIFLAPLHLAAWVDTRLLGGRLAFANGAALFAMIWMCQWAQRRLRMLRRLSTRVAVREMMGRAGNIVFRAWVLPR